MGSILVALVALVIAIGLIVGGTRFSLYLYSLKAEGNQRLTQRMPVIEERISQDTEYRVERQQYYEIVDTGSSSARYARSGLLVVALILTLAVVATISTVTSLLH